jgi:hypothetical protein
LIVKRETLSVPEAAKVLGISRGLAYEMARVGEKPHLLPSVRHKGRTGNDKRGGAPEGENPTSGCFYPGDVKGLHPSQWAGLQR